MSTDEAVFQAYNLASKDALKDVALLLRGMIQHAFAESKSIQWPPQACSLEVRDGVIPPTLQRFLSLVISSHDSDPSEREQRLIFSIGQDLCRAVSHGEWKLPKHILLCMTLRHLYRSRQLVTLLNRLGHSESYAFSLELEDAVGVALEQSSTLLTSRIVRSPGNVVFHSEWDNFNQFLTSVHGSPAFNAAAGIMLQESDQVEGGGPSNLPTIPRTKQRSQIQNAPVPLPSCITRQKKGPSLEVKTVHHPQENTAALGDAMNVYLIWAFCRKACSYKQQVPALGGFISATGQAPNKLTTIDFYPSITEPITEYKVVKELLHKCEQATREVGQKYTITTFDLGVIMKAMPIVWDNPSRYKNHIILIGTFHAIMNYLNMLGHKMAGSGYSEVIIEANLTTSGCLRSVLNGRNYNKSLWCLRAVSEALERLLIASFMKQRNPTDDKSGAEVLDALIGLCNAENLLAALQDPSVLVYLSDYVNYQEKVRNGELGKTAKFWMTFLDHSRRVFMLIYAVKTNNFKVYHKCMGDMADLFFSFGGINYARYLTWFDMFLSNIEASHPGATQLLENGAISVARSHLPGNRCAVDKTMEETFMKFAKSRCGAGGAGLTGILENYGLYQRWIRTTSERSKYYQATLEMCGLTGSQDGSKHGKHHEESKSEVKQSEAAVQRVLNAFEGFLNPFEVADKDHLYSLSSGNQAAPDVENDVLTSEEVGRKAKIQFIHERLQKTSDDGGKDFFDKLTKPKLKTMERANKKVKLSSVQGKAVQYQEQGDIAFQILVKSQLLPKPIDIAELMTYSLTPVPHSLGTPDGYMAKTNKAAAVHFLTRDVNDATQPDRESKEVLFIEDGNAHFHTLKDVPSTFKQISLKLLEQIGQKQNVIFSTDMYVEDSIKSQERLRRGCSEKILLEGINTRKPADFKGFLQNDENKKQLCKLMLDVWTCPEAAQRLVGRMIILIVEGVAYQLTSVDGQSVNKEEVHELRSNQEETDTRVILYLFYAKEHHYKHVTIRSPDSDIFFITLYYAKELAPMVIYFDTGSGNKRRLLNITELAHDLGPTYPTSLLGLYCFTGEDCNCAFKGKGKVNPLKKLEQKKRYQACFAKLGDDWEVADELLAELEEFVCFMYGFPRVKKVNDVRTLMLKKMVGEGKAIKASSKVDLSRMPPCRRSLIPHIKRANYRVGQWKHSHESFPEIPPPAGYGWTHSDGFLEPEWSDGPILPSQLDDLLDAATETHNSDDESLGEDDLLTEESDSSDFDSSSDSD